MSSIRERIIVAAITALNTDRPSNIPEFVRSRVTSPDMAQLPICTVYPKTDDIGRMRGEREGRSSRGAIIRHTLELIIEIVTPANSETAPDSVADPMLVWAVKALGDAGTFSNLANDPADEGEVKFEYEQADFAYCRASQTFSIDFQTKKGDATSR